MKSSEFEQLHTTPKPKPIIGRISRIQGVERLTDIGSIINTMERKQQILGQVVFKDRAERQSLRDFCWDYFGRSFSAQCRHMLLKAKREAQAEEKALCQS